jgi:hypothetical protein
MCLNAGGTVMTVQGTIVNGQVVLDEPSGFPDGARVTLSLEGAEEDFGPPPLVTETYEEHLALLRMSLELSDSGHQGRSVKDVFADIEREQYQSQPSRD